LIGQKFKVTRDIPPTISGWLLVQIVDIMLNFVQVDHRVGSEKSHWNGCGLDIEEPLLG